MENVRKDRVNELVLRCLLVFLLLDERKEVEVDGIIACDQE